MQGYTRHILFLNIFLIAFLSGSIAQLPKPFISSNLPIVLIETNGQEILDEVRIRADMKVINDPLAELNYVESEQPEYEGEISIEIRGFTSQSFPKKQYGFETCYTSGSNLNISLLGMPAENDWVLYAPYSDKSLIRNIIAYQFAWDMGQYAPRTRLCELILNGEYWGVYVLTEKIKRDPNRVNISEMSSNDNSGDELTGGYIYKIDRQEEGSFAWYTDQASVLIQCIYPSQDKITAEQLSYAIDCIREFEEALYSKSFCDPEYGYRSHIDINSFMDFLFVNEMSKNIDAYTFSTFLHKERDSRGGKLFMGPVWDFNLGFGNVDYRNGYKIDSLQAMKHPWWNRMMQDPYFTGALSKRWHYHRNSSLTNEHIDETIDSLVFLLEEAQVRNFERWDVLGIPIWPNYYIGSTWYDEVQYMREWIQHRINWIDSYFTPKEPSLAISRSEVIVCNNPFNQFLTLEFYVASKGEISFLLYDLMGNLKGQVYSDWYDPGIHKQTFYLEEFQVPNLENGLYILVMLDNGVRISAKKVLHR